MQTKRQNIVLLIVLNVLLTALFFYPILGHLNTIMLSTGGDGIKNYFTYLYFITYDSGTHFTGMNYPFGEHMVFTDNMPALSWTTAKLKQVFPGIVDYILFIMHAALLSSYFLSSIFIYKILQNYNVKNWWSVICAVFIAYFSPQFFRLFGHFGLGFNCFFPMLIYWMTMYEKKKSKKHLVYLSLCVVIFTFLHVYHLAFALVLIGAYCVSYLFTTHKNFVKKVFFLIPLICSLIVSIGIFKIFIKLTDHVTDRPKYPIGYLGSRVTGVDILTCDYNFIGANAFRFLFGTATSGSEGYAYIGLVTILICFYLIYRVIKSIFYRIAKRQKLPSHPIRAYRVWLLTALIALLFSMGVPFVWGLEFLADYFSSFRQFRTIGRFSWIFYYIMMIYAAIVVYRITHYLKNKGYKRTSIVLLSFIVLVFFIELNGYAQQIVKMQADARKNYQEFYSKGGDNWNVWLAKQGYAPGYFQGSIGLPYFHIGSEKLGLQNNGYERTMYFGSQIALQTSLKMMDVMMSRTSWSQTFESVCFFDGPFSPKTIVDQFNSKPFLLFVNTNEQLLPGEQSLLRTAKSIGNRAGFDFYELDLKTAAEADKKYVDSLGMVIAALNRKEGLLYKDSSFYYVNHFDTHVADTFFAGGGAFQATSTEKQLLASVPVQHPNKDSIFVCSAWMYWYVLTTHFPYVFYEQYDIKGQKVYEGDLLPGHSTRVINNWYKLERIIKIKPETKLLKLYVIGDKKSYKAIDELLIQPLNSIYFNKLHDSLLLINNRMVSIP